MSLSTNLIHVRADSERLPEVSAPVESGEIGDLWEYVQLFSRRWRFIGLVTAIGCFAGLIFTWFQSPMYRAKTSIEVQSVNGDFLNMKQSRPVESDQQGPDGMTDMQTQVEILQSDTVARRAREALLTSKSTEMKVTPSYFQRTILHKFPHSPPSAIELLTSISDSIKARSIGQTRVIRLQVDAPNAVLAADFANTLVTEYVQQTIAATSAMTEAASEWTRGQVTDVRSKLQSSEQALQQYAADNQLLYTSGQQNLSDDRIRQVQSDLLRAQADLAEKAARRNLASVSGPEALADVLKDEQMRALRAKLVDLQRQRAELLTVFKPNYTEVQKIQAQIDELHAALEGEQRRIVDRIVSEYDEAMAKERLLTTSYDDAVHRATNDSQKAVQYDILRREVDANLVAYQAVLARVRELNLAAAIQTNSIRVIDIAQPPERANSPKLPLNMALGFVSGLMLSAACVILFDRSHENLRHPGEALVRLGVPELGVITTSGIKASISKVSRTLPRLPVPMLDAPQVMNATSLDPQGANADDFRMLMTSILLAGAEGAEQRVIVVTSCAPQHGKTTVSSNLAVVLARAGKRVLLIDGDLRRPRIQDVFSVSNKSGFGDLLANCSSAQEALRAPQPTSVPGLSVLTAGRCTAPAADLLFDSHLGVLLHAYRREYEMVIVDTSPMMRIPDARLLARHADAVILVARANRTSRIALALAARRLAADHTKLLGVVLNDWNGPTAGYPYYN